MRPLLIVDRYPLSSDLPHLLQTAKKIEIEDFILIRTIEAFNKSILRGSTRLNMVNEHPIRLPLIQEALRQKLWTVIHTDHVG